LGFEKSTQNEFAGVLHFVCSLKPLN